MSGPVIHWNRAMLKRFKAAYALANIERKDVFKFDGHDFLVSYARYLIEYLDSLVEEGKL